MSRKSFTIASIILTVAVTTAARLHAQSVDVLSPMVVPARFTSNESPFAQSTTPLGNVPEGVTTYFWPEETALPKAAKVAARPASFSRTSYRPTSEFPAPSESKPSTPTVPTVPATWTTQVQSSPPSLPQQTLRPVADDLTPQMTGGIPCVCVPAGQPSYSYFAPQATYAYRQSLPVSGYPGNVYFGRGIIGQPKAYVPGQPLRNAIRYITP